MPSQHKNPLLGWHPPAELAAWARAEAQRREVPLRAILDEALGEYRDRLSAPPECEHPKARRDRKSGLCRACGVNVGISEEE